MLLYNIRYIIYVIYVNRSKTSVFILSICNYVIVVVDDNYIILSLIFKVMFTFLNPKNNKK